MHITGYKASITLQCQEGSSPATFTIDLGGVKPMDLSNAAKIIATDIDGKLQVIGERTSLEKRVRDLEARLAVANRPSEPEPPMAAPLAAVVQYHAPRQKKHRQDNE